MPRRIQRQRTKGWKMPPGATYVGRPTKWGNPYFVGRDGDADLCVRMYRNRVDSNLWSFPTRWDIRRELRGKDLMCWCPLGQPCHGDVLLEIANSEVGDAKQD